MQELKIHSESENDYLVSIKEKYNKIKKTLKENIKLTEDQKQTELKRIQELHNKEKKDSKQNLY